MLNHPEYREGWKNGFFGVELIIDESPEYKAGYDSGSELRDFLDKWRWQ